MFNISNFIANSYGELDSVPNFNRQNLLRYHGFIELLVKILDTIFPTQEALYNVIFFFHLIIVKGIHFKQKC